MGVFVKFQYISSPAGASTVLENRLSLMTPVPSCKQVNPQNPTPTVQVDGTVEICVKSKTRPILKGLGDCSRREKGGKFPL